MQTDPRECDNLIKKPALAPTISEHRKWLPTAEAAPVAGSASRLLTYDVHADEAVWEGQPIHRDSPIPE